ncbi:MAG: SPOR domain-containing protein [Gammaproteobacteria bacterium]|nr:SPOR domain-containing protein [Gammaproteobacteria bacterium]MDH3577429.1 SPOR domain-containing protein [Gammaproteobacteria bacterium]
MMERALKERIIGAAILVSFVVLVVPIFLDGPPGENEMVSERVLLPGQDEQKTQTVVLERNRTEPVPLTSSATAAPDPVTPAAAPSTTQKTEKSPPVVEKKSEPAQKVVESAPMPQVKPPPAASTTGMWAVQLGSFSNKENAEKLAADLRKQGYAAFLSQLATDSGQLHRVRIGPQKDRDSAEAMAQRLAKAGHKGQVVPHP